MGIAELTLGNVTLGPMPAMTSLTARSRRAREPQLDGAIGSDVLSNYARVTFDFAKMRLIVGPPVP